jgi:hypothetical protein
MRVPTPPATSPDRILSEPPPNGVMLRRVLVLRATVKSVCQVRPRSPPWSSRAPRLSSTPRFRMVPTLLTTKFELLLNAATGASKSRSLVDLSYQSMAPVIR